MEIQILTGDAAEQLRLLPDACVQTCITSPPYFGLRDYNVLARKPIATGTPYRVSDLVGLG